jgi:hypothetical protein
MKTHYPYPDFAELATSLSTPHLQSQSFTHEVIFKSLLGMYPLTKRTGKSGWAGHAWVEMWRGYEVQLCNLGLHLAHERLQRPRMVRKKPKLPSPDILHARRRAVYNWEMQLEETLKLGFGEELPPMWGDAHFHSMFRARLLYTDICLQTRRLFNRFVDDASLLKLGPKWVKHDWKPQTYRTFWQNFFQPQPLWYGRFGWREVPNPDGVFYTDDRVPYALRHYFRREDRMKTAA